jgi:hypothetical protein
MTDIICSYIKLMLECNCSELEMMIHQVLDCRSKTVRTPLVH